MTTSAVPVTQWRFCEHFGGAGAFVLYTIDRRTSSIGERQLMIPPEHGRGVFPAWLHRLGAQVILAGGMGPRALGTVAHHGIEVVLGVRRDDPDAMVERSLAGTLEATGEACHEHGFHDCGHHAGR